MFLRPSYLQLFFSTHFVPTPSLLHPTSSSLHINIVFAVRMKELCFTLVTPLHPSLPILFTLAAQPMFFNGEFIRIYFIMLATSFCSVHQPFDHLRPLRYDSDAAKT